MTNGLERTATVWRDVALSVLASAFLWWCVFEGARSLLSIWSLGAIRNRRGPDVSLADSPVLYWALNGFFSIGLLLCAGLALLCLLIALKPLFVKTEQ